MKKKSWKSLIMMNCFKLYIVMNIRFLFSILFVCGVLSSVSAQRGPGMDDASREQRKERIEAMRVSYITSALELNVEESQSFWPVYNEFKEKEKSLKANMRPSKRVEELTDNEAADLIRDRQRAEQELLNLKVEYTDRLLRVLTAKKVAMLPVVERKFKEQVLRELKRKRREGMKSGRRTP